MNDDSDFDKLTWDEVEAVAEEAFDLGDGQAGLAWAKLAWEALSRTGATIYVTGMDRAQMGIRFLALADLYRDFCGLMGQQRCESDYYEWAVALEVSQFRAGQLVGLDPAVEDSDDTIAFAYAVQHLTNEARSDVVYALLKGFRGKQKLFLSLLQSYQGGKTDRQQNGHKYDVEISASALVDPELRAFEWLQEGCPLLG